MTLRFFVYIENIHTPESFILPLFTRKVSTVNLVEEATPSLDRKIIKLPTFDNLFPNLVLRALFPNFGGGASKSRGKRSGDEVARFRHFDILAKIRSRVTTATTFSRQNDAGSHASIT